MTEFEATYNAYLNRYDKKRNNLKNVKIKDRNDLIKRNDLKTVIWNEALKQFYDKINI